MSKGKGWDVVTVTALGLAGSGILFAYVYFPELFGGWVVPRLSPSNEPITPQLPNPMDFVNRVRNRVVAVGVHPSLLAALDEWEKTGPFTIKVNSGVRSDAQQRALYAQGRDSAGVVIAPNKVVTYAKDTTQSAHGKRSGYGNALDISPTSGEPEEFLAMGEWFEARNFVWGGRWTKRFPPAGDQYHVEVKGWESIPV